MLPVPSPQKSPVKRSSASPTKSSPSKASLPDVNLRLHTNSICAKDTKLSLTNGLFTQRSNSVVHPKVQITPSSEGLSLGRCSIVSERCIIEETMRIGDYVLIEAGCSIRAKQVGDDCVIESAVVLEEDSVVGNGCRICAGERIGRGQVVPDGTVVFGNGQQRVDRSDQKSRRKTQEKQCAWLSANLGKAIQVWRAS